MKTYSGYRFIHQVNNIDINVNIDKEYLFTTYGETEENKCIVFYDSEELNKEDVAINAALNERGVSVLSLFF